MIRRILNKAGKIAAGYMVKKNAFIPAGRKMVSFSFDDFPISAVENGARLLESHNARGTFYVSLGLAGTNTPSGPVGSQKEMLAISERGHECGCHTYGHLNFAEYASRQILEDCRLNQKTASDMANVQLRSFAYPFGNFSPASKRIISNHYRSARTVEPGVNVNRIDLAALRAVSLYDRLGIETAELWLNKIDKDGGWLIFYTHDVAESPSKWGCSINFFSQVLDFCRDGGFEILTVAEATEICDSEGSRTES